MKLRFTIAMLLMGSTMFASLILAQTKHTVEVSDFTFTPANLTIEVGDTVHWVNLGGNHNVNADDGSFRSGDPSSTAWTYDYVFTAPGSYPYYCQNHGGIGGSGMSGVITVQTLSGISDDKVIVDTYELKQNFPNPFNPSTQIEFTLEESGQVTLKVYNLLGKEVSTLVDGNLSAGIHSAKFDGSNLNSGVYLYTIKTDNFIRTKKMILMK